MAEVYRKVGGKKIEKVIALHKDAQDSLERHALTAGMKAEAKLAQHRHDGHARIVVEEADVDRWVILDDERGLAAAMSIEYGRNPDENGKGGMKGLFILHEATGLGGGS